MDSHLGLPVIGDDLGRLESVHLPPFAAAVAQGADAVMTAHLLFPALAGSRLDPGGRWARLPATLNPAVLDRLLRGQLGFDGVIVTDALEMWGIQGQFDIAEVAVMALEAGRISRERLAQSVARVGRLQQKVAARRAAAGLMGAFEPGAHAALLARHRPKVEAVAR